MTYQELQESVREDRRAVGEAARQRYETEYQDGVQILPWGLKTFLDQMPGLTYGEGINGLLKQQGDIGLLQQRHPDVIPAIVGLIARAFKLTPPAVAAALGLPPPAHDGLDKLLLTVVRQHAHEARNGLLPLSRIVDVVNVGCGEGLTPRLIASRLRALGCVLTAHHPVSLVVIPRLLPPMLDAALPLLLPSPEESNARKIEK